MSFMHKIPKPDRKKEEELDQRMEELGLEKGDRAAMLISAWLILVPVCLVVLVLMVLFGFWLFGIG